MFSSCCEFIECLLCGLVVFHIVLPLLKIILTHKVLVHLFSKRKLLRTYGEWAVVTGATDGIGKAYCEHLAKEKINIVLISRSSDKLENVSSEIKSRFGVKTMTIVADFTKSDIYDNIQHKLMDLDIGVLVNNVGMSMEYPDYFLSDQCNEKLCQNMINCNATSMVMMSRIVTPGMVLRKRGAVINISSLTAICVCPLIALYGATKAFGDKLSQTITAELRGSGVIVQTVIPGYVATNMSKIRKTSFMVPSAADFADRALQLFGVEERTFPHLPHAVMGLVSELIPSWISVKLFFTLMNDVKKKAIKRKAKSG